MPNPCRLTAKLVGYSLVATALAVQLFAAPCFALEPREVFLLVNKNSPASRDVADHYCQKRGVPPENIIALDLPEGEDIGRQDFNDRLAAPLRAALLEKKEQAKVLLAAYGVPLRVGGATPTDAERAELARLDAELKTAEDRVKKAEAQVKAATEDAAKQATEAAQESLKNRQLELNIEREKLQHLQIPRSFLAASGQFDAVACVDSELMLLWWPPYELRGWVVNPRYWQVPEKARLGKPPVLLTCRLDGPTPEIAKRLVDDALAAEQAGLSGKVYVDARGIAYDPKAEPGYGYGGYDESMREMARLLKDEAKLPVILNDKGELFAAGSCPDCILYCGWYSLANFVDCCQFQRGAIAWHLASAEAVSLRQKDAKFWCKNQLEKGAAATLGPVAEPFTIGFPKPAEFFGLLATGKYTLVECYGRTLLLTSWMGVLVGDPLYNPFAKKPLLAEEKVLASPQGGRFLLHEK